MGAETWFIGSVLIIRMRRGFYWRRLLIDLIMTELRERRSALGLMMILAISCLLNLAVVMGVVPPKGVPMPFISYGGSSLLASLICVGLLLNLSRTGKG